MAIPECQSALTAVKEGQYTLNTTHRLPSHNPLPPSYVLIRPAAGVVALGSAVSKWQIGDSVCGFLYGLDPHVGEGEWAGAFAEYVSVPEDLVMRVVENKVSMAEAACLGAGVVTAGGHCGTWAFWRELKN
ncbi:hypothetical protein ETB97_007382 [Aspergillus alliaceus]|uniref:Alcohol dehydrogenase-like N-terminal domain-containing protein n=1 Tax=Petromyces alliaceus TaxID=209559 RepID=A0A8H6ACL1_PETAA|nr:hypothetical protein ETB97_007382 [Aspergillus burnettii]